MGMQTPQHTHYLGYSFCTSKSTSSLPVLIKFFEVMGVKYCMPLGTKHETCYSSGAEDVMEKNPVVSLTVIPSQVICALCTRRL